MTEIDQDRTVPALVASKLSTLPNGPGVYLMKDARDTIIYVGKAKVLRNRVRSYFQKIDWQTAPKVAAMVRRIADLDYVATASETEALILEGNLIKAHRPRYNVLLKDDKAFPYIKITNESFPQVVVTRKIVRDGARYFGPYTNTKAMRRTLDLIRKVFPLRTCPNPRLWPALDRPCLDFYIHRCPGPCKGHIEEADYEKIVQQVAGFLSGKTRDLLGNLREKMTQASAHLQFELAARLRDQIAAIDGTVVRKNVATYEEVDRDVVALARQDTDVAVAVLQVREGKLLGKENFLLHAPDGAANAEILSAFLHQYYVAAQLLPKEILLPFAPVEVDVLLGWLRERSGVKTSIQIPQRGEKAGLLNIAAQNASLHLNTHLLSRAELRERMAVPAAVAALGDALRMEHPPRRIETFDISNLQGTEPVASMVCFIDGRARKSEYRKFAIKEVEGPNDFAMMQEVVGRRYRRALDEKTPLPDLVVIDGGKGQLSSARQVLEELGLGDLPIIGLAKRLEEIFLPEQPEPVVLPKTSPALKLLMQSRDEAHRFALAFHRKRRGQRMVGSELDGIEGIGPKRRQTLLNVFGSVEGVLKATEEELATRGSLGKTIAAAVYRHFHPPPGNGDV
ncbi:MAG: excinuclease ABC subunit C [candidate division Zixibacteria bacterium]|nr:excinuclease ABC subunit C [candidate division Zixibacteria bacterium]